MKCGRGVQTVGSMCRNYLVAIQWLAGANLFSATNVEVPMAMAIYVLSVSTISLQKILCPF